MTTAAPIHNEISRNVRSVLAHNGLTQTVLAGWLGIKPNSASRLVTGQRPWSLDYLQVIADKLDVTVALLTGPTSVLMDALESQNLKETITSTPLPAARLAA